MSSVEITTLSDRVEDCSNIDEVLCELGLANEDPFHKSWFSRLPRFVQNKVKKWGLSGTIGHYICIILSGLFLLSMLVWAVYNGLGVAAGLSTLFIFTCVFSVIGTIISGIVWNAASEEYSPCYKFSDEEKRTKLIDYCRDLLKKYRNKLVGSGSNFSQARSRLEEWSEKAAVIVDSIEELLTHGPDKDLEADHLEAMETWEEVEEARSRMEKRRQTILGFLKRLEGRILGIDVTLGKGIIRRDLRALRDVKEDVIANADRAVVDLVISFGAEARPLRVVAQHLQRYSNAALEADCLATERGLPSKATSFLSREREVTKEFDRVLVECLEESSVVTS